MQITPTRNCCVFITPLEGLGNLAPIKASRLAAQASKYLVFIIHFKNVTPDFLLNYDDPKTQSFASQQ